MIREAHTSDREQILKFAYAMWQEAEGWVPADLSTKADINAICRFDICLEIQNLPSAADSGFTALECARLSRNSAIIVCVLPESPLLLKPNVRLRCDIRWNCDFGE